MKCLAHIDIQNLGSGFYDPSRASVCLRFLSSSLTANPFARLYLQPERLFNSVSSFDSVPGISDEKRNAFCINTKYPQGL